MLTKKEQVELILERFESYLTEYNRLSREYENVLPIPIYRAAKQHLILNKKIRLTDSYGEFLKTLQKP
jgi:hypothetical protein